MIPREFAVYFAPWEAPEAHADVAFWGERHHDLDFSPFLPMVASQPRSVALPAGGQLASSDSHWRFVLGDIVEPAAELVATYELDRGGLLHGVGSWFRAILADGVALATSVADPPTVWKQGFLPIEHPIAVERGDLVELTVTATTGVGRTLLGWHGCVRRDQAEVGRFAGHMFKGDPVALGVLEVLRTGRLPGRSRAGEAVLRVLAAQGDVTSVEALARQLHDEMPAMFGSLEIARSFVVGVATRYGDNGPGPVEERGDE